MRRSFVRPASLVLATGIALMARAAWATPLDLVPVGDPLEAELRVLEVLGTPLRIPRLGSRPLQVVDLPALDLPLQGPAEISRLRLLRALARDRPGLDRVPGATPRLLRYEGPDDQRIEFSAGLEGEGVVARRRDPELVSGSGLTLRFGAQSGRWLAFADILVGRVEGAHPFAERLFHNDAVLDARSSFLSYTGAKERWAATLGRGRWHWGPGEEGSMILSRTASLMTAFALRVRIEPLRADGIVLSGTLGAAAGEQLAAHRLEWQPLDGLRVGVSEAARYRASSWRPLYFMGVLPYSLVQSLTNRDEPDSVAAHRNNVIAGVDAAWRIAPGTRVTFDVVIDDLKTDQSTTLSKYGYQIGWEGVGTVRGTRWTWGTEYTRLTRYVYTSFFGQTFETGGLPLGFPTGPDSRRVRVRATWDPRVAWQLFAAVARTDQGENGIDVPFIPGTPDVGVSDFAGVVERSREVELGVRWWPASGLDLAVAAGHRWVADAGHQPGRERREPRASLRVRWIR